MGSLVASMIIGCGKDVQVIYATQGAILSAWRHIGPPLDWPLFFPPFLWFAFIAVFAGLKRKAPRQVARATKSSARGKAGILADSGVTPPLTLQECANR